MRKLLVITLGVALLAMALVAAGCGSSAPSGSSSAPPATAGGMTATQVLTKSQAAMAKVTSASFAADVTLKVSASGSSAQAMLLGQAPIVLHIVGKAGGTKAASAADVAMTLRTGAQRLALGVKELRHRTWVGFQGKWYVAPATKTSGATTGSGKAVGSLGIDPTNWTASSTVTTEQLGGATVYHVVTTADTAKIMSDIVKALNNPALSKATGSGAAALNQLKSRDAGQLKSLEKSLASASVQYWIDAATFLVRKGTIDAKLRFGSGAAAQGATGLGINVAYALSGFGKPIKVTPPAHALPLKTLTNGLAPLAAGAGIGL